MVWEQWSFAGLSSLPPPVFCKIVGIANHQHVQTLSRSYNCFAHHPATGIIELQQIAAILYRPDPLRAPYPEEPTCVQPIWLLLLTLVPPDVWNVPSRKRKALLATDMTWRSDNRKRTVTTRIAGHLLIQQPCGEVRSHHTVMRSVGRKHFPSAC